MNGAISTGSPAYCLGPLTPPSTSVTPIGDMESSYAFANNPQSLNQSTYAYTDGITLLRFAFLFVQGLKS